MTTPPSVRYSTRGSPKRETASLSPSASSWCSNATGHHWLRISGVSSSIFSVFFSVVSGTLTRSGLDTALLPSLPSREPFETDIITNAFSAWMISASSNPGVDRHIASTAFRSQNGMFCFLARVVYVAASRPLAVIFARAFSGRTTVDATNVPPGLRTRLTSSSPRAGSGQQWIPAAECTAAKASSSKGRLPTSARTTAVSLARALGDDAMRSSVRAHMASA